MTKKIKLSFTFIETLFVTLAAENPEKKLTAAHSKQLLFKSDHSLISGFCP